MREAPVLAEVIRGSTIESRHRGMIAAVTSVGGAVASLGDIDFVTYLRSSAKPFQALLLVASGAMDHFGISDRELAVIIGSHSGEEIHTQAVSGLLAKIGLDPSALKCGAHIPFDAAAAKRLGPDGPTVLHNNCSGKHSGMLALARFLGHDWSTYDHPDHPVQQRIRAILAKFADMEPEAIAVGTDGCGAPTFAMPIRHIALSFARLVCPDEQEFDESIVKACARVIQAMSDFPEMVGAIQHRLDTDLMTVAKGKLIAKVGAEGVYTVGMLPCEQYPMGLGVALKIEDGDDRRIRGIVAVEALKQLDVLTESDLTKLSEYRERLLKNHRGDIVGHVRAKFQLEMNPGL